LYTTHVIEAGLLTTSLNPNKGERIFQNMSTYSNYVRTARYQSSANASNKKSAVSREESAKKKTTKSTAQYEPGNWPSAKGVDNVSDEQLAAYRKQIIDQINEFLSPYIVNEEWDDAPDKARVHAKVAKKKQQHGTISINESNKIVKISDGLLKYIVDEIINNNQKVTLNFGQLVKEGLVPKKTQLDIKITRINTTQDESQTAST